MKTTFLLMLMLMAVVVAATAHDSATCQLICRAFNDYSDRCQVACETNDDSYRPTGGENMSNEDLCDGLCLGQPDKAQCVTRCVASNPKEYIYGVKKQ